MDQTRSNRTEWDENDRMDWIGPNKAKVNRIELNRLNMTKVDRIRLNEGQEG